MGEIVVKLENVCKVFNAPNFGLKLSELLGRIKNLQLSSRKSAVSDPFVALNDVTLKIKKGEKVGVIGKNGSGKSTLMKVVLGVMQASGTVETVGTVGGLIELTAGFKGDLSAIDNVYVGAALMGKTKEEADQMLDTVFELAELENFRHTAFKNYSSGMKVRLGFCLAMMSAPDIVLLDEVLAVGDASFRKKSIKMIDEYLQGRTLLFVSHSMSQIRRVCDRVIVFDKGKIVQDGGVEQGISKYDSLNETSGVNAKAITEIKASNKHGPAKLSPYRILKLEIGQKKSIFKGRLEVSRNYYVDKIQLELSVKKKTTDSISQVVGSGVSILSIPAIDNHNISFTFSIERALPGEYFIECKLLPMKNVKMYDIQVAREDFIVEGDLRNRGGVLDLCFSVDCEA